MNSITDIWIKSKGTFDSKSLAQILSFAGDGKGIVKIAEFQPIEKYIQNETEF